MKSPVHHPATLLLLGLLLTACGRSDPADARHGQAEDAAHPAAAKSSPEEPRDRTGAEVLKLSADARQAAGLVIVPAGPAELIESLPLYGVVRPNAERVRSVTARFPGVVRSVEVKLGDSVRQGAPLARIESNESLQVYTLNSPLSGVVTERFTNPGEQAEGQPLFTVADLSSVWVELSLFPRDRARVQPGQAVRVQAGDGVAPGEGRLVFVSPLGSSNTQSLSARVLLDNRDGRWTPGLYVQGEVAVAESRAALAVPAEAVQVLEGRPAVFVETTSGFEVRPVRTGRGDGAQVEILAGLAAGEPVVAAGSFVLKAELGKGEAEHGH